ncbi:MAG TPA: DNA polymerase III subunit beta [Candidatus Saccharimonadales bacterium]|nr:DNA polymerase III subunit beta [Candidatus Saccharimonadales bacterium]
MKVTIQSDELQKKLSFVSHAISTRSQLPILLHVLLEAKDGKLQLSATDLEIGIETSLPATIEEEGSITIPAKLFLELVNSLPADKVVLQTKGTTVEVICRRVKSNLAGLSHEEFPTLFEDRGEPVITLAQENIRKYFSRVCFAASTDTTRPALSGILLQKKEEGYLLVATDGYRLSLQKNISIEENAAKADEQPILIPARVIREVLSEKGSESTSIFISRQNNQVLFEHAESLLIGRLIEAEYPKYQKIIPADFSTKIFFDRDEMQKAIKTCAIFARETANIIKLSIKKDAVVVSANTPSVGDNVVEVESKLEGEENEIAFNARYLLDLFANIEAEQMSFEMTGPLNSGVFRIANDPSFLHLIMPIRTQG